MKESYANRAPPVLGTVNIQELEDRAREKLKNREGECLTRCESNRKLTPRRIGAYRTDAFMYVCGSAGTNSTTANNRNEFQRWKIIPRMLYDATNRSVEASWPHCCP